MFYTAELRHVKVMSVIYLRPQIMRESEMWRLPFTDEVSDDNCIEVLSV